MSNNLVGIETRNRKKVKNAKTALEETKNSNTIKIVNDHSEPHIEIDDEFQKYQNKKLKTENNSNNKNALQTTPIASKNNLKDTLHLLQKYASDIQELENKEETLDSLKVIFDYKYNSQKVIFTKDIFERKLKTNITPAIFTKKNLQIRSQKLKSLSDIAFENYLNLVAQLYYKATLQSSDILSAIEQRDLLSIDDEQKPLIQVKKPGKRGRKAKPKPQTEQPQEALQTLNISVADVSNPVEEDNQELTNKDEVKINGETLSASRIDVIDFLVNPLKVDCVFEKWSPKEIAIFEAGLCKYGKEFSFIQFLIKTKAINEVIEFYFAWKGTSHYRIWKYYKNLENKQNYNNWL